MSEDQKSTALRRQIIQNHPELRELEAKLRAAYVKQEQKWQIKQKEYERLQKKCQDKKADETYLNYLSAKEQELKNKQEAELMKRVEHRQCLENQIIVKEHEKNCRYADLLKERDDIEEIVRADYEVHRARIKEKLEKMEEFKKEINQLLLAKAQSKEKEMEITKEENNRIQAYITQKEKQLQAQAEVIREKENRRAKLMQLAAKDLHKDEQQRLEREQLITELLQFQAEEQAREKEKQEQLRREQQRKELIQALDEQIKQRERMDKQMQEQDKRDSEIMMQEAIERKKLEEMTRERRVREMLNIRRDIERAIAERERKRGEELKDLWRRRQLEIEAENEERRLIEEHKRRLIREHAGNLEEFVPWNMLDKGDFQCIPGEVIDKANDI